MPEYVSIRDVELFSVGMNWPAAHGQITFRFDHLADAVTAQDDPHIVRPRISIGHSDPTFNPDGEHHNPFVGLGDGYPALGSIENMRLENEGAMVVGDFVEVPDWFAEVLPSAYPNRSIEGSFLDGNWDVETPGGKKYGFVLTKVALLGIYRPAVEDLEDLRRYLTEGQGVLVAGTAPDGGEPVAAQIGDVPKPTAQAEVDQVIGAFWAQVAGDDPSADTYWYWPRSVWTDPNFVVADNDEGGLLRYDFTSNDAQEVTFGEPARVLQKFVDAPAAAVAAAAKAMGDSDPLATFSSRAEAGREAIREGGQGPSATNQGMDHAAELRKVLGLPEDCSDDTVQAKLAERDEAETTEETTSTEAETETTEETGEETTTTETTEDLPPAASLPEGMVAVPADQWKRVQEGAAAGASLSTETETKRRDETIVAATGEGRIRPTDKASMEALHKTNRDSFYSLLTASVEEGGLRPGLVPVDERGSSRDVDPASASAGSAEDMARLGFPIPQEARS